MGNGDGVADRLNRFRRPARYSSWLLLCRDSTPQRDEQEERRRERHRRSSVVVEGKEGELDFLIPIVPFTKWQNNRNEKDTRLPDRSSNRVR